MFVCPCLFREENCQPLVWSKFVYTKSFHVRTFLDQIGSKLNQLYLSLLKEEFWFKPCPTAISVMLETVSAKFVIKGSNDIWKSNNNFYKFCSPQIQHISGFIQIFNKFKKIEIIMLHYGQAQDLTDWLLKHQLSWLKFLCRACDYSWYDSMAIKEIFG